MRQRQSNQSPAAPTSSYPAQVQVNIVEPVSARFWLISAGILFATFAGMVWLVFTTGDDPTWWQFLFIIGWMMTAPIAIGIALHKIVPRRPKRFNTPEHLDIAPHGMTIGQYSNIPWSDVLQCHYLPAYSGYKHTSSEKIELSIVGLGSFALDPASKKLHEKLLMYMLCDPETGAALYRAFPHSDPDRIPSVWLWLGAAVLFGTILSYWLAPDENPLAGAGIGWVFWMIGNFARGEWRRTHIRYRAFYLDDAGRLHCTQDRDTPIYIKQLRLIYPPVGAAYVALQTDQGWLCGEDESWKALTDLLWKTHPWCQADADTREAGRRYD
ncbi:hypothetical protein [Chitinolyticbacter albus]|uniref:hypothetical protein n=1 Tax=Chitinolyticbacter albus TaxID=2961951 RepID=UPI00210D0B2E|nr:hypothetical protein [Chitinolyticbacter albus]